MDERCKINTSFQYVKSKVKVSIYKVKNEAINTHNQKWSYQYAQPISKELYSIIYFYLDFGVLLNIGCLKVTN